MPWWPSSKESACNPGDLGLTPGLRRTPGEGKDNPFQYSCLGNPMDRGAWQGSVHGVTESQTQFNNKNNLCPFPSSASTPVLEADGDGCAKPFSHDRLFATLWTVAHQAPLSMGFPSNNTGVGCLALFQGLFLTQRSNQGLLCLLHWQVGSLSLAAPEKPGEGGDDVSESSTGFCLC